MKKIFYQKNLGPLTFVIKDFTIYVPIILFKKLMKLKKSLETYIMISHDTHHWMRTDSNNILTKKSNDEQYVYNANSTV